MFIKQKKILIIIVFVILVITSIIAGFILTSRNKDLTYEEKVLAFEKENVNLEKGQIVFVGDSITAKYNLDYHYPGCSLETYNRGISGDTTNWLLTRMKSSVFDISPSKIVIMIGTNDINMGRSSEQIAENYGAILDLIALHLPDAQVFCISIIPQNTKHSENAAENNLLIQETNRKIKALAEEKNYQYVDLYSKLLDDDLLLDRRYSTDGLHLGHIGYKVWTKAMQGLLDVM